MMDNEIGRTIHILDPITVTKIAAGEVVERPGSVVKELVENSIDAHAGTIRIEIKSSKSVIADIRVVDDGIGMTPHDAILAFTPHATSKIHTISDLNSISTLGFRGEALASIASVSKVTLWTKTHGNNSGAGTRLYIESGIIQDTSEVGTPEGTNILVQDLFYNTPVRRKFLKKLNTEITHIVSTVESIALAHPEIGFKLIHNGNELLTTERSSNLLNTIIRIFGNEFVRDLIPIDLSTPFMSVSGYISKPSLFRKNLSHMLIAINGRIISSPSINMAILKGYGTLLPKERFPVTFLYLTIDTTLVDVNVHPTKKQVRMNREQEICSAVQESISAALLKSDLIPAVQFRVPNNIKLITKSLSDKEQFIHRSISDYISIGPTHTGSSTSDRQLRQTELLTGILPDQSLIPEMDVIGQFGGIYILASTIEGTLILIDQHAAHERVMYELVSVQDESIRQSQELITPKTLHRTGKDAAILHDLLPSLANEGFLIEEFGKNTFLVRAIPVVLGRLEQTEVINDIIDDLIQEEPLRSVSYREKITRIIACRSAIKAGTACTGEQCQRLIQQLRKTKNPYTCPHGRPTMIRFSRQQLDFMFKRT
ncbi:MAG: DNA mismatch repair endonuclease MutL [Methanoregulaceae archaeon]|jgi:DNA mismatch repair protein MutL